MTAPKKPRRWPRRLAFALVVTGLGALVAVNAKGTDEAVLDEALITKVKKSDLVLEVIETGKIAPREKVDIKSKVSGQVLEVLVVEGQAVKKGQLLLRLDPVDYEREVARADAELAQAKQAHAFAVQALARRQAALAERAVAEADVEQAHNDAELRAAAVRIAEVEVSAAKDRLRACNVTSPLSGTIIQRGVEAGEVVTAGVQATVEGKPLLTVADLSTLLVKSELNQIDVGRVALGQSVKLTLDALPGQTFTATVSKIAPAAVRAAARDAAVFPIEATVGAAVAAVAAAPVAAAPVAAAPVAAEPQADKATAAATNAPPAAPAEPQADKATAASTNTPSAAPAATTAGIKSGMTADVRILVETRPAVLLVPIEAVVKEEGKSRVNKVVVDEHGKKKGEKIEVTVGKSNDREMEVLVGLKEGDELVVDPGSAKDNEANL